MNIDALPYIGAAHQGPRPAGTVPDLIVLHSGETNEGDTAAEGMAGYFASGNTIGSAHICVDNDSAVRCAPDENRTNGAGGVNNFALHLEQAGRAGQLAEEWADPYSSAVVANAAEVLRGWIAKFPHIRPVFLDAAALDRGERDGITTHNEVSQVFAGNDGHWDPGPFYPIDALLHRISGTTPITRRHNAMTVCWINFQGIHAYLVGGNGVIIHQFTGPANSYGIPQDASEYAQNTGCGLVQWTGDEWSRSLKKTGLLK